MMPMPSREINIIHVFFNIWPRLCYFFSTTASASATATATATAAEVYFEAPNFVSGQYFLFPASLFLNTTSMMLHLKYYLFFVQSKNFK